MAETRKRKAHFDCKERQQKRNKAEIKKKVLVLNEELKPKGRISIKYLLYYQFGIIYLFLLFRATSYKYKHRGESRQRAQSKDIKENQ